ncbi:MAG: tRNA preQ1(34) S-adenosylmethionine ribosyltransferase-isomerase QueA [Candidatus Komeilibacteria bacterium RIFCSPLOWO2_01_FULL_45_10]|uniref:S-adenosylmethionine:tRNA ribosyltransferase-isomerase n=1 Tax=Candidatus Komeilibacteria bacterium RIFCSPLOWO2_01_FULL_45_10 TaxID=1798550 RepID=A0A1G2BHY2_9BACT|nr:MAG: tRNA preQ1(34) S-adenosylmethionine ribosyltransferase-isomerase QueA [Candidatus Komeilibacteria bacterium RIFCSPLOWO2_01_FULL_45_10]
MKLSNFDYYLPKELIAQQPVSPRDSSRLMVVDRRKKKIEHKHFYDIFDYLKKGDILVLNDTRVFPARLIGHREKTGGRVEVFLLARSKEQKAKNKYETWEALIGNRRKKVGQIIEFGRGLECQILKRIDESVWEVRFNKSGRQLEKLIDKMGNVPTPPYVKTKNLKLKTEKLKNDYQTVYAKHRGSVAAPTAGFHFTKPLINKLKRKGVQFAFITLHVGFGTFEPVKVQDILKHKMHAEVAVLDKKTAEKLNEAKKDGRRIIAVGTTTVRTLETFVRRSGKPGFPLRQGNRWTDIFIYPGYKFKFVDAMITNFHLPQSTLLMLISAFAGRGFILKAYQEAIKKQYRFYSFGDSMFIY